MYLDHSLVDTEGSRLATEPVSATFTAVSDGSPVVGSRDSCFLCCSGSEIHWKKASFVISQNTVVEIELILQCNVFPYNHSQHITSS